MCNIDDFLVALGPVESADGLSLGSALLQLALIIAGFLAFVR
jgi:hypothetical protein